MIRTIRSALKECVTQLMLQSNRLKNCTKTNLANLATIATGESVTGDH